MNKNIYVPENQVNIIEEAESLFKGETSLSQLILEMLEKKIKEKKFMEGAEMYVVRDAGLPVKIIGKKMVSYFGSYDELFGGCSWNENVAANQERFGFTGYKTRSGKYVVEISTFSNNEVKSSILLRLNAETILHFLRLQPAEEFERGPEFRKLGIDNWRDFIALPFVKLISLGEDSTDHCFVLPKKFQEDFRNAIDEEEITTIID